MKPIDAEKLLEDVKEWYSRLPTGTESRTLLEIINNQPEIKGEPYGYIDEFGNFEKVYLTWMADEEELDVNWIPLYTTPQDQSASIAELEGKLRSIIPYAKHGKGYEKMCEQMKHSEYPCTCGLERLLKQIDKAMKGE